MSRRQDIRESKYAVTRVAVVSNIARGWRKLVAWFESSSVACPPNWRATLEELISPLETDPERLIVNLYLPIAD